jgi:adenosylmethionine-8-amino-7-oxononanoate aminotransferase
MNPQPDGWLQRVAQTARHHRALLVADEVMTGFGRTGTGSASSGTLFACHHENVQPDFMALAKGLTGGYLPMAATLTNQAVFDSFLGDYADFKTFFHGHSFTGNQLGAAVALESLRLLREPKEVARRKRLETDIKRGLSRLWNLERVGDIRQVGVVVGVELVRDWRTRTPYDIREQAGIRVCEAMASRGVLTRSIGSVVVLMPPYCTTANQLDVMIGSLEESVREVLGA